MRGRAVATDFQAGFIAWPLAIALALRVGIGATGRCSKSGVSVVSSRSAKGHCESLCFVPDTYAESSFVFPVAKAVVSNDAPNGEVQFTFPKSSVLGWVESERRVFLSSLLVRRTGGERIVQLFWIVGHWCEVVSEYFFDFPATACEPRWTSSYVPYGPAESYGPWRNWRASGRLNLIGGWQYHNPWSFNFRDRLLGNIRLTLDREQGEESDDHIGGSDPDHEYFSNGRLWSNMVGVVLFFVGCGFAYQAARFWLYLGDRGTSVALIALSFGCLFFGQALVLFGFWGW